MKIDKILVDGKSNARCPLKPSNNAPLKSLDEVPPKS